MASFQGEFEDGAKFEDAKMDAAGEPASRGFIKGRLAFLSGSELIDSF